MAQTSLSVHQYQKHKFKKDCKLLTSTIKHQYLWQPKDKKVIVIDDGSDPSTNIKGDNENGNTDSSKNSSDVPLHEPSDSEEDSKSEFDTKAVYQDSETQRLEEEIENLETNYSDSKRKLDDLITEHQVVYDDMAKLNKQKQEHANLLEKQKNCLKTVQLQSTKNAKSKSKSNNLTYENAILNYWKQYKKKGNSSSLEQIRTLVRQSLN